MITYIGLHNDERIRDMLDNPQELKRAIACGEVPLDYPKWRGHTHPLEVAVQKGYFESCQILAACMNNVEHLGTKNWNCVQHAVALGNLDIVQLLYTAFPFLGLLVPIAVQNNHPHVLRWLLSQECFVDHFKLLRSCSSCDMEQVDSVLQLAIRNKYKECLEVLWDMIDPSEWRRIAPYNEQLFLKMVFAKLECSEQDLWKRALESCADLGAIYFLKDIPRTAEVDPAKEANIAFALNVLFHPNKTFLFYAIQRSLPESNDRAIGFMRALVRGEHVGHFGYWPCVLRSFLFRIAVMSCLYKIPHPILDHIYAFAPLTYKQVRKQIDCDTSAPF
jgi:hypothetical protein